MAKRERWYFAKEELENSPSRRCGIDTEREQTYRQQAANLIQDMGQKLKVTQLVINTAIVYMHRFYTFHSFSKFHRNAISACALFLAAKVEEQPRKLEHVIRVSQICIFRENMDIKSEQYQRLTSELVYNENLMLRTLGFDLNVQHPHTSIVNCCQLVRATKYIAETSYYLATNSLHLSTLCLQYKPTVVACICIYFVCKWSNFQFAKSSEGKDWWAYVDNTVNKEMLEQLMSECLAIFQKCPQRIRKCLNANKINSKLPNNPLLKQMDDMKPQLEKPALEEHAKHVSKVNLHDSRQMQNKTLQNAFNDAHTKKDASKTEASNNDNLVNRLSAKHVHNHQSSQPTASLFNKESSPFSNLQANQSSSKSFASKEITSVDDRLKSKDAIGNSSFFDKMKSNLSVIPQNPLGNNLTNCAFNENFDSNSLFPSNDASDLTDFALAHKKDLMPDLKMEFSDNEDSNPSDNNISFASTLMMNDSNDSKSLSHAFSSKTNFEMTTNYDFKLKPNFSQFSSHDLPNSMKPETKIEPNQGSINSIFPNSESKFSLNSANNVLPNPIHFSKQITPTIQAEPYLDLDSKIDSLNEKSTNIFANKKAEVPKNNLSTDSFALTSNLSTFNNDLNPTLAANLPSITSKPALHSSIAKHSHENSKSILNQSSAYGNILQQTEIVSDSTNEKSVLNNMDSSDSDHSKRHKKKHKKHKKHDKHKHKHKHKDKDKEKYSSFKVVASPNQSSNPVLAPLKLKISKAMIDPQSDEKKHPLKLKISLANHSSDSPSETVSRKRKHEETKGKSTKTGYDLGDQTRGNKK